jgi:tRNA/rRNA methyltransferase
MMFGRERWGLENDEVAMADVIITAPVNPAFASLNIAQAVLLVGYEWYKLSATSLGMGTEQSPAIEGPGLRMAGTRPATRAELMGLFGHLEAELEAAGFFKSPNMRPTMVRNLHNIFPAPVSPSRRCAACAASSPRSPGRTSAKEIGKA